MAEHTLSEEFLRNAEPIPDNELPPVRSLNQEPRTPPAANPSAASSLILGAGFAAGILVAGVLVLGVVYLLYRFTSAGAPAASPLPSNAIPFRVAA